MTLPGSGKEGAEGEEIARTGGTITPKPCEKTFGVLGTRGSRPERRPTVWNCASQRDVQRTLWFRAVLLRSIKAPSQSQLQSFYQQQATSNKQQPAASNKQQAASNNYPL